MSLDTTRRRTLAALAGATTTALAGCRLLSSPEPVEGSWPMQGRTKGHVASTQNRIPDAPRERWRTELTGWFAASPVLDDNRLVAAGSEHVYCLDAASGRKRWETEVSGTVVRAPAMADDLAVVSADSGVVHALDLGSGESVWQYDTGPQLRSAPTVHEGTVYVGGGDDHGPVVALDLADGSVEWSSAVGGTVADAVSVSDGTVYAGRSAGETGLVALDAASGERLWQYSTSPVLSTPVAQDGTVYVPADTTLHAIGPDGTRRWSDSVESVNGSASVTSERVFYRAGGGTLRAVDRATGERAWERDVGEAYDHTPVTGLDGVVTATVGASNYGLECFDAASGERRWRIDSEYGFGYSLAAVAGLLFAGTIRINDGTGSVVAFEAGE